MRYLKKMIKRNKKKIMTVVVTTALMVLMLGITVFASEPTIASGTKSLFKDATSIVIGLGAGATTLMAGVHGIRYIMADKEEKPGIRKQIIHIVIGGVAVTTMSGTITWVLGHYTSAAKADAILIASNYITTVLKH